MMSDLIRAARVRGPHPQGSPDEQLRRLLWARLRLLGIVAAACLLVLPVLAIVTWLSSNLKGGDSAMTGAIAILVIIIVNIYLITTGVSLRHHLRHLKDEVDQMREHERQIEAEVNRMWEHERQQKKDVQTPVLPDA